MKMCVALRAVEKSRSYEEDPIQFQILLFKNNQRAVEYIDDNFRILTVSRFKMRLDHFTSFFECT